MNFRETEEQLALRKAVAELGRRYGHAYTAPKARAHEPLTELWDEAGRSGLTSRSNPARSARNSPSSSWRSGYLANQTSASMAGGRSIGWRVIRPSAPDA